VRGEQISLLLPCFRQLDLVAAGNKAIAYRPGVLVIGRRQQWEFLIRLPGVFHGALRRLAKQLAYPDSAVLRRTNRSSNQARLAQSLSRSSSRLLCPDRVLALPLWLQCFPMAFDECFMTHPVARTFTDSSVVLVEHDFKQSRCPSNGTPSNAHLHPPASL
jgi:hypothetical protein